ncbi:hypothetical protein OXPF_18180 [Oxobacter pfennigii]|uniref:Uncharacterized protein n=1 Tax=Oxobacter pfennigii TaxID=36849 RepID=A0A0P9AH11_9CLOT|nr:hypothetical protein [Oxobacter pfennigii]KPU44732.1 hypothetical protein OXPF_18180 [Oxobacter pfennigii]
MKSIKELQLPEIGQTIILTENYGKRKIRKIPCRVEGIYNTYILVKRQDNSTKESFMKSDFLTGFLEYEKCAY